MNLQEIKEKKRSMNGEIAILGEQIKQKTEGIDQLKAEWRAAIAANNVEEVVSLRSAIDGHEQDLQEMHAQLEAAAGQYDVIYDAIQQEFNRCEDIRKKRLNEMKQKAESLKEVQSQLIHGLAEMYGLYEGINKTTDYMEYLNKERNVNQQQPYGISNGYEMHTVSNLIRSLLVPEIKGVRR